MRTVLLSIQAVLSGPNPGDPAEAWKTSEARAIEIGTTTNAHNEKQRSHSATSCDMSTAGF